MYENYPDKDKLVGNRISRLMVRAVDFVLGMFFLILVLLYIPVITWNHVIGVYMGKDRKTVHIKIKHKNVELKGQYRSLLYRHNPIFFSGGGG